MAATYFTLPSLSRAKQNQEQPVSQKPVLKDRDAAFLKKEINTEQAAQVAGETAASSTPAEAVQDEQPNTGDQAAKDSRSEPVQGSKDVDFSSDQSEAHTDPSTTAESETSTLPRTKAKQADFPSQEEAEAATRGWDVQYDREKAQPDHKTWISFLASYAPTTKKSGTATPASPAEPASESAEAQSSPDEKASDNTSQQRSWAQYASSVLPTAPSLPALPSLPTWKKAPDSTTAGAKETLAAEDEKQEREISSLLDKLNMSTVNNHVFALSSETQKLYERFAQILKDTINGVPTAYQDMETFLKDAGPQLDKQFKALPPFVQALIKTLPAKFGTTLGPELLAAAGDKPGYDLKQRQAAEHSAGAQSGSASAKKKTKRRIPEIKNLMSKEGAVAGILRSIVNFLKVRFPFLASATNVLMSLAVFVLMFVFWYCHKRGKETRLAQTAEAELQAGASADRDVDDEDSDDTDDDILETGGDDAEGEVTDQVQKALEETDLSEKATPAVAESSVEAEKAKEG